jgi:polar amino acid transport system substrate-binding protein
MKRCLFLSMFVTLMLTGSAAFAADECTKITATGHPQYPVIAYKDGDNIVGAAPTLVETIAKQLNIPLESKYVGTWEEAQAAARDGKADIIFGIYYNDERATYLDYVQPAFTFDDVAIFVVKGKEFPFTDKNDLVGKKGVTNQGESYGNEFDAFMKEKLDVARANQALLSQEMFVAFSKKSPCASLAGKFGEGITQLTTDDSYDKMLVEAQKAWEAKNK